MKTYNNRLMLEPYVGSNKIEAVGVKTGFATVKQKSSLIGLKVMADGLISIGNHTQEIKAGQVVFYEEEVLYTNGWPKKTYTCTGLKDKFVLAPVNQIVMIK